MLVVSAPGKAILFGEHSVVHSRPAIAAAVGLRSYLLVTDHDATPGHVIFQCPDLQLDCSWPIDSLPFADDQPRTFDEELLARVIPLAASVPDPLRQSAAVAFLYLYVSICSPQTPARRYLSRSKLPIGAGLGSSASVSVCLAAAFLHMAGPELPTVTQISDWSFLGEKCIHGNPSGIDNAVAARGGAVLFQRPALLEPLLEFPPLKLVLTNTGVPRRTAELVAGVGELVARLPAVAEPLMDAMAAVALEAKKAMEQRDLTPAQLATRLAELARINQGLLHGLGVGHPSLEKIQALAEANELGQTKLTGAGGGGCALTVVTYTGPDLDARVAAFANDLPQGYTTYETDLGSRGVNFVAAPMSVDEFLTGSYEGLEWVQY